MFTANIYNDLFGDSILNTIYAISLMIGVLYSIFLLFFHGIEDALGGLHLDLHIDIPHVDLSHFDLADGHDANEATGVSMLAIASFVTAFGGFGLLSVSLLDAGAVTSLFSALMGGIFFGIAAQLFFLYILSPTISSEVRQVTLIGMVAEITTPIPAQGIGQIAFVAEGSRMTYSARATDDTATVPRGTPVRIERIVGGMAYVSKLNS